MKRCHYLYSGLILSLALLTSCQTTSSVSLEQDKLILEPASFVVNDSRPVDEKNSYDEFDAVGKNSHFGDDRISPNVVELFKKSIQQSLNKQLSDKTIVLTDFLIIVTDPTVHFDSTQSETINRVSGYDPAKAQLNGLMIYGLESTMGPRNVYVRITGTVDGKEFSSHIAENFRFGVSEANMKGVIRDTLSKATSQVKLIAEGRN